MRCDLSGKVCLVTGAARGIGQEIATQLAANGGTVVFTDVDEAGVREASARVAGAHWRVMDVTKVAEVEEVISSVAASSGKPGCLGQQCGCQYPSRPRDDRPLSPFGVGSPAGGRSHRSLRCQPLRRPSDAKSEVRAYHQHRFNRWVGPIAAPVRVRGGEGRASSTSPRQWPSSSDRMVSWSMASHPDRP